MVHLRGKGGGVWGKGGGGKHLLYSGGCEGHASSAGQCPAASSSLSPSLPSLPDEGGGARRVAPLQPGLRLRLFKLTQRRQQNNGWCMAEQSCPLAYLHQAGLRRLGDFVDDFNRPPEIAAAPAGSAKHRSSHAANHWNQPSRSTRTTYLDCMPATPPSITTQLSHDRPNRVYANTAPACTGRK